jgi:hypothetical protein
MKSFAQKVIEDRRLVILRLLSEQRGQQANSSVIHMGLSHLAIVCERHELIDDLRFLQLHSLISLTPVIATVWVAELLGRGEDVIHGRIEIDGVTRPRKGW